MSALKLYLATASPISPGCTGGGGLAGCAFSGGVSFYEKNSYLFLTCEDFGISNHVSGKGTYLYVGDWKNAHSPLELSLIPILINFPEDVDRIAFLK